MTLRLNMTWAALCAVREAELRAQGQTHLEAHAVAHRESQARQWIEGIAGSIAARQAEVTVATAPSGEEGVRFRVDLASVSPERRAAAPRALAAGWMPEVVS